MVQVTNYPRDFCVHRYKNDCFDCFSSTRSIHPSRDSDLDKPMKWPPYGVKSLRLKGPTDV